MDHDVILHPVPGIRLAACKAGLRYPDRRDLVLIEAAAGGQAAAVFTRNRFCAAPVRVARQHLAQIPPRLLVINTGSANAGTGRQGDADARTVCRAAAQMAGCQTHEVLPFSTGVIGEPLPVQRVTDALPGAAAALAADQWAAAADGIRTTDTVPKAASRVVKLDSDVSVRLTGIAKGAGMVRPDMATVLVFLATDACVDRALLQTVLIQCVDRSFHRITVDGDTSTNDACVLLATHQASMACLDRRDDSRYAPFRDALAEVMVELAQGLIRDAEGATKFISVQVRGGDSEQDCLAVAFTVAQSPLVKTAMFAGDANWGRILAAVGRSPVKILDPGRVNITINNISIVRAGQPDPGYEEAAGAAAMAHEEIRLQIDIGHGTHSGCVWTSDLSHEYVRINAEYRT